MYHTCFGKQVIATVDKERFAGLNICNFSIIEVFMEILSCYLGHKCSLFSTIKEGHLYSWKNFRGTPENCEKCESLAQQIFPHLRYTVIEYSHLRAGGYVIFYTIANSYTTMYWDMSFGYIDLKAIARRASHFIT